MKKRILTGITTTGIPHLGNYVGAIRASVTYSKDNSKDSFYFLADYHALVKCRDATLLQQSTIDIAAAWLALGLDTEHAIFYRQSDVPEINELHWILSCVSAKGLANRAHAYKAVVDKNCSEGRDADYGLSMGLFSYPILMAADILLFNADHVPVGPDQVQHIEIARDIAQRFNHHYGTCFVLPEAELADNPIALRGLDGRKMSKSYENTIPLFCSQKKLRQLIAKIKTNSLEPSAPKSRQGCLLFELYQAFATENETQNLAKSYEEGIAWGSVKEQLFELLDTQLAPPRQKYEELIKDKSYIRDTLNKGALRARAVAQTMLDRVRCMVGIRPIA